MTLAQFSRPKAETPNRILIDYDAFLYRACFRVQKEDPDLSDDAFVHRAFLEVHKDTAACMYRTGTQQAYLYLTPKDCDKAFRSLIYPAYKKHRSTESTHQPRMLYPLMELIQEKFKGNSCLRVRVDKSYEADDLIAHDYPLLDKESPGKNLIFSNDKDLRIVPGIHWHHKKKQVIHSSSTEQFFQDRYLAYQLLVGDLADNIPGIKKVSRSLKQEYTGIRLQGLTRLENRLNKARNSSWKGSRIPKIKAQIKVYKQYPVNIGEKTAKLILKGKTDHQALTTVREIYQKTYGDLYLYMRNGFLLYPSTNKLAWVRKAREHYARDERFEQEVSMLPNRT